MGRKMAIDKEIVREIGKFIVALTKLIDDDSRHLIAKMLDIYWQMPSNHQEYFLRHICEQTPLERKWIDKLEDETEWANIFREIIWYYSGRSEIGQPSKKELKNLILKYVTSNWCEEALEKPSEKFGEMLEEL